MNITDNEGIRLLMELVGMPSWPSIQARYNVAPTAVLDCLAIDPQKSARQETPDSDMLALLQCQWGMVPAWAKPGQFSSPLINARCETVWEKPSFRNLVKHQRVCVPVNGFYEWHRPGSKGGQKTPYYIHPAESDAMFVAGIFQRGQDGKTDVTLLTTAANEPMSAIHHRMPVIIGSNDVLTWLGNDERDVLDQLMQPAANDFLTWQEVGSYVNNARNEGPQCVEPA